MRILALAIIGMLVAASAYCNNTSERDLGKWVQQGSDFDASGHSLSLSSDGNILAIGDIGTHQEYTGHVRIYEWNGTVWIQRGNDIEGSHAHDLVGDSVSLSSDGTIVAIGAPYNNGNGDYSGHVRIYEWNETEWIQRGNDIEGEAVEDHSGTSLSLSSDGTIVAIGAPGNDGNGDYSGHVRTYQWNGAAWIKLGSDIEGEAVHDYSGYSVSLSADGTIVAIGASGNDGNGVDSGHVRIYEWNGETWIKLGNDIDGEAAHDHSGMDISLSSDGTIVAIGAYVNDGNGVDSGHVRIYEWNGIEWIQRGKDLDGEGHSDMSSETVSLSSDGTIVAISGHVRIYEWNGIEWEWIQKGSDIDAKPHAHHSAQKVSLSADGSSVAMWENPTPGVRVYQWDETGLLSDDPALAELADRISQISLTPGPQGPPGEVGAPGPQGPPGADAPCKPCADVASAAVALACKILHANPPNYIQEIRDTAEVVVATLMISANVCELDCDIGEEINAAIANALNK